MGSERSRNGSLVHDSRLHERHTTVERSSPPKTSSTAVRGSCTGGCFAAAPASPASPPLWLSTPLRGGA
eukprot:4345573-Prymnesium_polylepis.1